MAGVHDFKNRFSTATAVTEDFASDACLDTDENSSGGYRRAFAAAVARVWIAMETYNYRRRVAGEKYI